MSTFGTYLLVFAALIGTLLFIYNPGIALEKWAKGKKSSDLGNTLEKNIEENPLGVVGTGCLWLFHTLLGLLYSFAVEPIAIIAALINKLGFLPIAYAMLAIVAINWVYSVKIFSGAFKGAKKPQGAVVTKDGKKVEGTVVEVDEELKIGNPVWNWVKRIFFFLPDLYLWYLFFVVIGVIK